ncbi:glycosyltransferase family 4 protein [Rhodohalobacter sp.]|uniref:glycosyltransferase family 4 protein n=1 Tax=Rhodohalobacter sp. TaxID=1974210 RepID=UPI002ACE5EFD|nr:glycosyltransferase family 4 protein [Rhodohalobacter sp.]MDZ7757010.1 glycosyltransferase family 4 protein [Rhodohalobacter sp.]
MNQKKKLLIIGKVWPEPSSSAAGSRMLELIDLFQRGGYDITFATSASDSSYAVDLADYGVNRKAVEINSSTFNDFVRELKPDVVMFDRFMTEEQFGWRVVDECPEAVRILDTEDLHSLRAARQNAWKSGQEFTPGMLFDEEIAKREIASIYRCDLSLIISEFEFELLQKQFKLSEDLLCYLPFLMNELPESSSIPFEDRDDFVSIGNFLHEPNWNAVLWLKEEIWPLIHQKLPNAKLNIYGAYPSQKVYQLQNPKEGFLVHGRAESAEEVLSRARVLLAPLRFGAGLKGKLADAMKFGTPSVTTSIGAEGIEAAEDWPGAVLDDPAQFANSAVKLHQKREIWDAAQKKGFKILKQRFDKEKFADGFLNRLTVLHESLRNHRKKNFTGSLLMHHYQQGTKYMSKWIEEKNKH